MPFPLANLGSWFGSTVNTVISPFYALFSAHATYCFTARTNVRNHRSETEILIGNRHRIREQIDDGHRNGLIPSGETDEWLQRANQAISEEETNRQRYEQRCRIFGCCSINCWGNYRTGKQAAEKLDAVKKCISSTPLPDNVTRVPPPPPVVDMPTHSIQLPQSREVIIHVASCCIKDDPVGMLGMWGPDRDEKTHLLKKINNSFLGECPFDFVIFVTASIECSVQNIQAQIIDRLRINHHDDVATQATMISKLLETKSFLVLVDDLCQNLDLFAVGIPYPLGAVGKLKRKVVITSPSGSRSIFNLMAVNKHIEVPRLEEEEARELFKQYFGAQEDPNIGALAKDLVRELKGLPSELIHFGKVMKEERDARQWEAIIEAVRKSNLQKDDPSCCVKERIVRNLEDASKDLLAKANDIRQEIENAERQSKTPTDQVNRWLGKVEIIILGVEAISAEYQSKKDVTMRATEKLRDVQECLGSCPSTVAVEPGPPAVIEIAGTSLSAENFNLKEAIQLIEEAPTVGVIGIWGPGGVGKTHLLNNINSSFKGNRTFHFVIFVTAPKECSVENIQEKILDRLKLPKADNVESQRHIIHRFLENRSFLVLLDDLWDRIDLGAVGIPYPLGTVNQLKRKVVLTTRSRKVCGQMEVRKELKVAYMQEDEAWQLFQEKVGHETLSSSPLIEALARELVKELKGLPLALITIGRAMYAKTDTAQWEYAIQHMRQSCYDDDDPLDMEKAVFSRLKFSYDSLRNDTLRHCFLTCALWPEDWSIKKVHLVDCWMGLGLVDDRDIQISYTKAYSLMGDLTAACLLDVCGELYDFVQMHDVVRDMALWISCGCGENNDRWFVRAAVGTVKNFSIPWNKAEYVSLKSNGMEKLPPVSSNQLKMLCLGGNRLDRSIIGEEIKKFTSLTYLDLSSNFLWVIPEELCSLANLEYLNLSWNVQIREVPHCFGNLIKLKFLNLRYTSVRKIPEGVISSLKALQIIDLRTSVSSTYSEEFVSRLFREMGTLPHLKAVGIKAHNFVLAESLIEAAKNIPIRYLYLTELSTPEFCFSDILSHDFARRTLYELKLLACPMEQIIVRHELAQPNWCFRTLSELSLLSLSFLKEITCMGTSPASLFPRLTSLEVSCCYFLKDLCWAIYLPCLEHLDVHMCSKMQQAFMSHHPDIRCSGQESSKTFPRLKYLRLRCCKSLVTIGDPDVTFPSLEVLEIKLCIDLKRLPFQMDSLPLKLRILETEFESWEALELEDGVKSFLQPRLQFSNEIWGEVEKKEARYNAMNEDKIPIRRSSTVSIEWTSIEF